MIAKLLVGTKHNRAKSVYVYAINLWSQKKGFELFDKASKVKESRLHNCGVSPIKYKIHHRDSKMKEKNSFIATKVNLLKKKAYISILNSLLSHYCLHIFIISNIIMSERALAWVSC
jgi:hypothetical protein